MDLIRRVNGETSAPEILSANAIDREGEKKMKTGENSNVVTMTKRKSGQLQSNRFNEFVYFLLNYFSFNFFIA